MAHILSPFVTFTFRPIILGPLPRRCAKGPSLVATAEIDQGSYILPAILCVPWQVTKKLVTYEIFHVFFFGLFVSGVFCVVGAIS